MNVTIGGTDRGSVPTWLVLGIGVVFTLLALVMGDIPTGIGVACGLLIVGVAVWDALAASAFSAGGEALAGLVTFVLPWFGGFAGSSASWIAWIFGVALVLCAAWSWASHPVHPSR